MFGVSATGLQFRGFVIRGFCRFVVFEVRFFGYVVSRTGFLRFRGFAVRGFGSEVSGLWFRDSGFL